MKLKIACALALLAPFAYGQNALKNPGFEEDGGWNHWGGERVSYAKSGKFGLKITNIDFKWSGSDQIIVLPEGIKDLTLSGWVKVDSVVRGNKPWERARIALEFYDKDMKQVGGHYPVTGEAFGTRDWRKYEKTYSIPPNAFCVKIQLALGNATGTVYFDDVEVLLLDAEGKTLKAGVITPPKPKPYDFIRLNQAGYYTHGPKNAVIVSDKAKKFSIIDANTKKEVFSGKLEKKGEWEHSGEVVSMADFSKLTSPGTYIIRVPGVADSHKFEIANSIAHNIGKASLKTFYYQRTLVDLEEKYAGKWKRKAGHPDNEVLVHASAATAERPAGTKISSPRGWYDAGDYNKYVVNSGISTYTMMALYEHFPKFVDTVNVNIPESGNNIPDLLDETLFNVRWILSMQDPNDGGVYHKLTNPNFDGIVMPHLATEPRYVVQKSTAAALDFAAVMAQASRVYRKFDKQLPGFADSTLAAAIKAYEWAKKNPEVYYDQNEMNKKFTPAVVTGEYGDKDVKDEFQWAASELFITTGDKKYYTEANIVATLDSFGVPAWPEVNTLGLISLVQLGDKAPDAKAIQGRIIKLADELKDHAAKSAFGLPMGIDKKNFVWGSSSIAANQAIILIQAYRLTKNQEYLNAAIANFDYIMGRNGTGYSYVSGFGTKAMTKPHHRPSQADGLTDVIPGFLSGGPNYEQQDKQGCMMPYPSALPAKSYIDEECSYASNEVAINWNSPLTYLAFALEAIMAEKSK
ncbi:MAG: glycoside hydrolase family 9 protein [Cytophagaceae bacterium]